MTKKIEPIAENCKNCGAELYAGQQFCRSCGTPTVNMAGAEMPTQILGAETQPEAPTGGTDTTPLSGGQTNSVYPPRSTSYHPPGLQPMQPMNTVAPVSLKGKSRGWIVAFLIIALMGAATLAALLMGIAARRNRMTKQIIINKPHTPPRPPAPPRAAVGEADEETIGDEDADAEISDDETTGTRTFKLNDGASVTLRNMNGEISVEGWDEPEAEVKIVKHGGSEDERGAVRLTTASTEDQLALSAASGGDVKVSYEIKLPRTVRRLEIFGDKIDVELSDIGAAALTIDVKRGDVKLEDVGGSVKANIINGSAKVSLNSEGKESREPSSFTVVKGDMELRLDSETNADLNAEVIDGEIEASSGLGLKVEKRLVGQHVAGRIGAGGQPVSIKVIKGNVKIRR